MTMPVRPQDIRKGMWLVVTDQVNRPAPTDNQFGDLLQIQQQASASQWYPTGVPIKVHAVSLPMVVGYPAVAPDHITVIDITRFVVRKPSTQYVNVFINHYKANIETTKTPELSLGQFIQTVTQRDQRS